MWLDFGGKWTLRLWAPTDRGIKRTSMEWLHQSNHPQTMGTSSHNSSASRSCSPHDMKVRVTQSISEMFPPQASSMGSSQGLHPHTGTATWEAAVKWSSAAGEIVPIPHQHQHPSLNDLWSVATDIKETLTVANSDLRIDTQSIAGREHKVEKVTANQSTAIRRTHQVLDTLPAAPYS